MRNALSESRFKMLSEDYEKEQEELRQKIALLEEEIQNQEDQVENFDRFIRQAKKCLYLEKLTPTVLNDMVGAVYVHAPDKSSGYRVQDADISYNYIGILPANLTLCHYKRKGCMTEIMQPPRKDDNTVLLNRSVYTHFSIKASF